MKLELIQGGGETTPRETVPYTCSIDGLDNVYIIASGQSQFFNIQYRIALKMQNINDEEKEVS